MKRIAASLLGLVLFNAQAADPAPPASSAPPAVNHGQSEPPSKEALQQAFDGAMTCSALCALISTSAKPDEVWRWKNRSYAFGMLARNFYMGATQGEMPAEDMDKALTAYANSLQAMSPTEREPFDTGCARKYAQMDKLCEANGCLGSGPGTPEYQAPAGAPAAPAK